MQLLDNLLLASTLVLK